MIIEIGSAAPVRGSEINNAAEITGLSVKFGEVLDHLTNLTKDTSYKGINLLQVGTTLTVYFAEGDRVAASKIVINGVDASTTGLGITDGNGTPFVDQATTPIDWSNPNFIDQSISDMLIAINTLRQYATVFGTDYNVLQNREAFSESLINVLGAGADKLTLADMNEESANMLSMQTRHQLGINSLSLAAQTHQGILSLFY